MNAKPVSPVDFKKRLVRVQKHLAAEPLPSALLLSSAASQNLSRDTSRDYRQSSDFYYLTGCCDEDLTLLVSGRQKRPVIFATPADPHKKLWTGAGSNLPELAAKLNAELVVHQNRKQAILQRLKDVALLYYQNEAGSLAWEISRLLLDTPSHQRGALPARFAHSDVLLEPMRLFKDAAEIKRIKTAASITNAALLAGVDFLGAGVTEIQLAAAIECFFRMQHSSAAFPTIVASGRSAATLHHTPQEKNLKPGELVLIDLGAEHELYAADISRTLPVSGRFDPAQRDLYQAVLQAQKKAISKVRDGVLIRDVYMAAAAVMTDYLRDARLLKGARSALLKERRYLPWFPHSIGHSLGIDVHDVGNLRGNHQARLRSGMVFTIEPGLYFAKKERSVPACGVRIEDDVLVTQTGCEVLSAGFPKEIDEIEALFE